MVWLYRQLFWLYIRWAALDCFRHDFHLADVTLNQSASYDHVIVCSYDLMIICRHLENQIRAAPETQQIQSGTPETSKNLPAFDGSMIAGAALIYLTC